MLPRTVSIVCLALSCALGAAAENGEAVRTELVRIVAAPLEKTTVLPGELSAFQRVEIHAKIAGFISSVAVDRGSRVKKGEVLAKMTAPEIEARRAAAQARIPALEARRIEAQAKLEAVESAYERLHGAAQTPGIVAGNDVILAEKAVEAARARVEALKRTVRAAEASVRAIEEIGRYLEIVAPFNGRITARYAHVGTLAGPEGGGGRALFRLEETNRLRLTAAVPEAYLESIRSGTKVSFTVPAYPGVVFRGVVARPAHSIDPETRTMPVELDVSNASGKLVPGMYAEVRWPIRRSGKSLFAPPTAIKATSEQIFVIRVRNSKAEWVDVRRGMTVGNLVEVFGDLSAGDAVVLRATDEIRPGTRVEAR